VRLFRERPEAFDLLLFDLVMPTLSGREARDEIRRLRPAIPTLLCSGYDTQNGRAAGMGPDIGDPVIAKPYDADSLLRRVREVLDRSGGQAP
jgi:two-component system, cell cycle sensor histidine kinase and response regulator CckA